MKINGKNIDGIENIEVINRWSLLKDLRSVSKKPISELNLIINKLDFNTTIQFPDNHITDDVFSLLEKIDSHYIKYDVIEEPTPEPIHTELIDNVLVNSLGLTESEKWFNTLTDEQKIYVQDLSHNVFFIVCTG